MASIDDVRVNGQISSTTATPVVAGTTPLFTWDFVQDPAAPAQERFEIRIGADATDHGTDSFSGQSLSISESDTSNKYQYIDTNLVRGTKYYGQIRGVDSDGDKTPWNSFTFQLNRLPFVTGFSLSPSAPSSNDDIELSYTFQDPDNHEESGTKIRWFRNNLPQSSYDDLCILPANATSPGESWTAKIIPSDGLEFGPVVETTAVSISNIDVNVTNITILPSDPNVDDLLKVVYTLGDTEYFAFNGLIVIEWYINGVAVSDSNKEVIRLNLSPGDEVYVVIKLTDGEAILSQSQSLPVTISDVPWHIFNLEVSGLKVVENLNVLQPILTWETHKTTVDEKTKPNYLQVKVTKTESLDGPIYDSGVVEYVKDSFDVPDNVLQRGQKYYIHVGADDSITIPDEIFTTIEVTTAGSSWGESVNNSIGWTLETKIAVAAGEDNPDPNANFGIYVHDGTYFTSITFGLRTITVNSGTPVIFTYDRDTPSLQTAKTFKVAAKGQDLKVFMNNKLVLDAVGALSNTSQLKFIEYGDTDAKNINNVTVRFFRYSTLGAFGFGDNLPNENTFYFKPIGKLEDGSIDYVLDNIISWLPDDQNESAKLILFNENAEPTRLPTVTRNYSPITSIYIDENRNKFIGTANGVTAIYGEKHDPDYSFDTGENTEILPKDFDRISTVPIDLLGLVEPNTRSGWFTIDTTYRAIGQIDNSVQLPSDDEYDPYVAGFNAHAIHYYSQRTHGHPWYDKVDNEKGWQVSFSFDLDLLEADDFEEQNLEKTGFGVYINDGTYQEIVYFYDDRIRLFYANVFVPINTQVARDYTFVGKGNNLQIFQKLKDAPVGSHQLLVDGSGMFTTPGGKTGNSRKPKITLGADGLYHAVWHDDANRRSQIFYSSYDGSSWSNPELVTQSVQFNLRNPDLDVDSNGRVWVVYEDTSWGPTEIVVSVKDDAGWNPKTRITNSKSKKENPTIKIDSSDDVHLLWEDNRNGHVAVFWAEWQDSQKAWISSGQFGSDTPVMQYDESDPYQSGYAIEYKNPQMTVFNSRLWVVAEGHLNNEDNEVLIYRGFRDLDNNFWSAPGAIVTDSNGNVSIGSGTVTSNAGRISVNPSISASNAKGLMVVAWEDRTSPVSQIWGAVINRLGNETISATQITNQTDNAKNPSVGWISNQCAIAFEKNNGIYISNFNTFTNEFSGSATGGEDRIVSLGSDVVASNPAMPDIVASKGFIVVYDFYKDRDPYTVRTVEFPDFQLIGSANVDHGEDTQVTALVSTNTTSSTTVNNIDTKEFAFGDFAENIGFKAHWQDLTMYFGYDARPYSISQFNTDSVPGWPDNRINSMFIDVFGNIIAATFGGILYYNTLTAELTVIDGYTSDFDSTKSCSDSENDGKCLLRGSLTTSVAWGGNGIWYVGTTSGVFYSDTAGRVWNKLFETELGDKIINDITVNTRGEAIIATSSAGVFVAHPNFTVPSQVLTPNLNVKTVAVDEADIIWAGSDTGLFRIENLSNILTFNRNQGMRSSHVNDIAIVNKHLRYIATATGVERMNGMKFTNFNVNNKDILNDNIASLQWDNKTQSLWIGALYSLHEIIFRDPVHDIIDDEIVQYSNLEISTEQSYDTDLYFILDFAALQPDPNNPIEITPDSVSVFINRNKIDFGYTVDKTGQAVLFVTDLLIGDQVEVEISNQFISYHDFNQKAIERSVQGEIRTSVKKMDRTSSRNQLLLMTDDGRYSILLFAGESQLPFTTLMIDRDAPRGCLEQLAVVTPTKLRFRILAFDSLSGIDGYMLSNFENFTSDGETPQNFIPFTNSIVEHDIGSGLTTVFDSLAIPDTATLDAEEVTVGSGTALGTWFDEAGNVDYLYAGTSSPAVIFRYDPVEDEWTAIDQLNPADDRRTINEMVNINNVLWVSTGTSNSGGAGGIYRSTDGLNFDLITSVTGDNVRGIAGAPDGTVYFGSSDGKIYSYKDGDISIPYQNIGSTIYSLSIFADTLVVATGDKGRVYSIDLETGSNFIVFDGSETFIRNVFVKDSEVVTSPDQAILFASSGTDTTIYRASLDNFDFIKSYSSFGKTIRRIKGVESVVLVDPSDATGVTGTTTVAAIGSDLFKHAVPSWEFVYKHNEEIQDMVQYSSNGVDGVWIISDNKVTKWTSVLTKKTVYLKLKDKAGNESPTPQTGDPYTCPTDETSICCNYAYSINIDDLKDFVNESRIVDVSEYGEIIFTYDAPNDRPFYSADQIDQEVGIYNSEIFNGSNDLVSWKQITWSATEPEGTSVDIQIRSGVTEDEVSNADWSANLTKDEFGQVSIEFITNQYIQFRAILKSSTRDTSPSLTSVTITNITASASHFFTTNFVLPSRPIKGLLTANTFIPVSADIVFGLNTKNTVDFGDYQVIEPNRIFTSAQNQFGTNMRIGAKLLSPGLPQIAASNNPGDPYDESSFVCDIQFSYTNLDTSSNDYHFRVRFYNDVFRTQLVHTFFSGNDQSGWTVGDVTNVFSANGISIGSNQTKTITYTPDSTVDTTQKYYVTIDAYNGSFFETVNDSKSYICSNCFVENNAGLIAEYYGGFNSLSSIPDFSSLDPAFVVIDDDIDFAFSNEAWTTSKGVNLGSDFVDRFAARWRGRILAPVSGTYTFTLESDDGSKLFIDREEIIDFDGLSLETTLSQQTTLTAGFHDIEVQYFANLGPSGIKLKWTIPGETEETVVPAGRLFYATASEYCDQTDTPRILNFAVVFEMENGETVKINL